MAQNTATDDRNAADRFPTDDVTFETGDFVWIDPVAINPERYAGSSASQGCTIVDVDDDELVVEYPRHGDTETATVPLKHARETTLEAGDEIRFEYDSVYSDTRVEKQAAVVAVHRTRAGGFDGLVVETDDGKQYSISSYGGVKTRGDTRRRIGDDAVVERQEAVGVHELDAGDVIERGDGSRADVVGRVGGDPSMVLVETDDGRERVVYGSVTRVERAGSDGGHPEPTIKCSVCGARYFGDGAAAGCCSGDGVMSDGGVSLDELEEGDEIRYVDPRDGDEHTGTVAVISTEGTLRVSCLGYVDVEIDDVIARIETDGGGDQLEDLAADPDAERECGICGGVATRKGRPNLHKWRGQKRLSEGWKCRNCETGGALLRDLETGEPLRLPHVLTGNGFVEPADE